MKKYICLAGACLFTYCSAFAQLDIPPSGGNPRAMISEEVGITSITIRYARPDVNKREGKIWGEVVPWGFASPNLLTNKNDMPWRAGANENTTIQFEHDVKVEGRDLKAGTYGLFMAVWPDSAVLIFSKQSYAWGSYYYDPKDDALRVIVRPAALPASVEYLRFEFLEHKEKSCLVALQWEKLSIPFRVDVDVDNIVLARLREEVSSQKGFNQLNLVTAANFCLNKNINLEEALGWAQRAANLKSFPTLNTLATAYTKLGRLNLADSVMNEALVFANPNQYLAYARAQIAAKRTDRAQEVLTAHQKKNGDVYAVHAGWMYFYSAKADFKKAQEAAAKALAKAPNDTVKKQVEGLMEKLKEGKDINQ